MRRLALACAAALFMGSPAALSQNWGLAQLMESMAQIGSASASFTESKTLPILTTPLLASGRLDYVAPNYIRKTTLVPMREDFVLRGSEVTLTAGPGQQTHQFSLTQEPAIGGLAEGIRAALAGDLPALQNLYIVTLSGSLSGWQLVLQPKDPDLKRLIAWMAIHGTGNRIHEIDTEGGDASLARMRINEDAVVAR